MDTKKYVEKKSSFALGFENYFGFILLIGIVFFSNKFLASQMLHFRLLIGTVLGYALTRAYMGFAGSVNRAFNTGSTKLMKVLMLMFVMTAIGSTAFLYNADVTTYNLWVNPINFGLILGGLFFGFGMSFVSCCASGVLTDLVTGLPRAIITLFFFGMGVFLGFPIQSKAPWIRNTWFSTSTYADKGVFLPDLFANGPLNGYVGAILLTIIFASIVVYLSSLYEKKIKAKGCYTGVCSEKEQEEKKDNSELSLYERLFVKPWTMELGATVITGAFILLMGVTKAGWGASTHYGFWFGKFLMNFGVSPEVLAEFSNKPISVYTTPIIKHGVSVQNIGIILGTIVALALAGNLKKAFTSELKISFKDSVLFAMGGFFVGFGTRLANGCNVGALYTPIANFSLSGWVFLAFLVAGGVIGNIIKKALYR